MEADDVDAGLGGFNNFGQLDDATLKKIGAEFRRQESTKKTFPEEENVQTVARQSQMSFSHRFLANESASLKKAQDEALKSTAGQENFSGNFSGTPYKSMG